MSGEGGRVEEELEGPVAIDPHLKTTRDGNFDSRRKQHGRSGFACSKASREILPGIFATISSNRFNGKTDSKTNNSRSKIKPNTLILIRALKLIVLL
jgi:hypothetical protein